MRFVPILLTALLFVFSASSIAQERVVAKITGRVTGDDNKGLSRVTVEVQEGNQRTVTGEDGSFSINAAVNDILVLSKKDFATTQQTVTDAIGMNIRLKASKIGAGEEDDVVIPFGTRKKREI
ncbi:MAG: hypothetical protein WKF91_11005, partial [Segetibacter sp.]